MKKQGSFMTVLETIENMATAYGIPWLRLGYDLLLLETDEECAEYFLREEGYCVDIVAQEEEGVYITSKVMEKTNRRTSPRFQKIRHQ
jgi:hypothetical protein